MAKKAAARASTKADEKLAAEFKRAGEEADRARKVIDRDLIARDNVAPPPRPELKKHKRKRAKSQVDRCLRVIPELNPHGVPAVISKHVVAKVVKALRPESERLGLADPSPRSVRRAFKLFSALN